MPMQCLWSCAHTCTRMYGKVYALWVTWLSTGILAVGRCAVTCASTPHLQM